MDSTTIADIDRRVEVIDGSDEQKKTIHRVSDLRGLPHVVLLGEPGSGKTTVLESEAGRRNLKAIKVGALIHGIGAHDGELFIDALDEYRSDGQGADKAHGLAKAIEISGAQSWWLTCRAEDWRKEADIQAIGATTRGRPIVVAQLSPLNYWESVEILRALGQSEPDAFMEKAYALGAEAFTHNPLSLRLLRRAVQRRGQWPKTRFELFEAAVQDLAYEENSARRHERKRPAPDDILATADTANLMLLLSGTRALWRSGARFPDEPEGRQAFLTNHSLGVDASLLGYTLDTPLYRGEGEAFEPMHRTIAEFTAARALANAVRGSDERAAFPLSRALALITSHDGGPPTELRGLFAWFAAHLAKLGDRDGAIRLIETDAATIMSYGDAAVFDTECRRAIFHHLDRETPYFRSHEYGSKSVSGLAGEDLADNFAQVLRAPLDGTQRMYTVLDALAAGAPVRSLKPLLREMALDANQQEWVRRRAAEAWLNGHANPAQGRRELFDALSSQPMSMAREIVRLDLVRDALDPVLTTDDLKSLISAFRESGRSNTVGRMMWLKAELKKRPRPDLFDTPIRGWLCENSGAEFQYEINEVLDEALAAVIRAAAESLTATNLLQWLKNASWYEFPHPDDEAKTAVCDWVDMDAQREIELLLAIKGGLSFSDNPRMALYNYQTVTGRSPSITVMHELLSLATDDADRSMTMLDMVYGYINNVSFDHNLYWRLRDRLSEVPRMALQFESMRVHEIEPDRLKAMERGAKIKEEKAKEHGELVAEAMNHTHDIATAKRPGYLEQGARFYFGRHEAKPVVPPPGIPAVIRAFNFEVANAMLTGWSHILTDDFEWPSVAEIGEIEAQHGSRYYVEYAVLAALDLSIEKGEDATLARVPLRVAISALRHTDKVRQESSRRRIEAWAIERICRDVDQSAVMLLEFWTAALSAGSTDIALLSALSKAELATPVLQRALHDLLRARPSMPVHALCHVLAVAAKYVSVASLRDLTNTVLANAAFKGQSRRVWMYVDFALNPSKFDSPDMVLPSPRMILAAFDLVLQHHELVDALDIDQENRPVRRAIMISALGRSVPPSSDYPDRRGRCIGREELIRRSINILGATIGPSVGVLLSRLIAEPALKEWRKELMHARFQHMRLTRDHAFAHPSAADVRAALAGKAPVNSADLRAVALEELRRLQREIRTGLDSPWQEYWDNIGKRVAEPKPKIENKCRDHLILRLTDRMRPYGVNIALAEVQHAEQTRSDIALFSHIGKTFPIEIKRDSNAELWRAASTQLRHYADADTADGYAIYLVFWFNHPGSSMPPRPDGGAKPVSAEALERMLREDLPQELRNRFDIIVFDVSDPNAELRPKKTKKKAAGGKATRERAVAKKATKEAAANKNPGRKSPNKKN